jgi:hypothetical protein
MDQKEAQAHMDRLLQEAGRKVADRNVGRLKAASNALQPGQMNPVQLVSNALADAHRIVDNYEKSTIELESRISELEARLSGERDRCIRLEKMLQEIVDLVSPR